MAEPSPINPINSVIQRQYLTSVFNKSELFSKRLERAKNLFRKDLLSHYGCVNAIEFSNEGELLISGGDDRRVLLWSVPHAIHDQCKPIVMTTTHLSNIFCLGFDSQNSKIFSAGNDDNVIVHDLRTGSYLTNFLHEKPVYGLSVSPQNDYVFASAGEDGRVLVYDIRESSTTEPLCLARYKTAFHAVMFNPMDPRFVATANTEEGISLWDNRKPREPFIRYGGSNRMNSGMSVRFNANGSNVLALRRRLPPILYPVHSEKPLCQFYHPDYYNSCTMKSCSFAGENDEYVLSGSDDFNLYMWKIPKEGEEWGKIHMVLLGHRSIVNQVRFNKQNYIIASSGVEKMVKLWSPLAIGTWDGSLLNETNDKSRQVFSHEEYISLVQNSGQLVSHDYSLQSTQEDSRMMAFFDSLVQREIEGWHMSDDSMTSESDYDSSSGMNYLSQLPPDCYRSFSSDKKGNRIAQLIFEKREKLAKMAQQKKMKTNKKHKYTEKQRKKKSKSSSYMKLSSKVLNGNSCKQTTSNNNSTSTSGNSKHSIDRSKTNHKSHKYKTRSNTSRSREKHESHSSESLDVPSTSTGITASSSSVYRIFEQDSDEEQQQSQQTTLTETNNETTNGTNGEEPLINILPTPLNGTHDMYINILQVPVQNRNNNVITVRNESVNYENNSNNNNLNNHDTDSSSNETEEIVQHNTPNGKYNNYNNCTPDSGISSRGGSTGGSVNSIYNMPCSSGTSNRHSRYLEDNSDDPDWGYETFKKRVKRARLNLRNNINHGDSDSN